MNNDNEHKMAAWVLDHDLSQADLSRAAEIQQHVSSDAAFAQYLQELESVRDALSQDTKQDTKHDAKHDAKQNTKQATQQDVPHGSQAVSKPSDGEDQWVAQLQEQIRHAAADTSILSGAPSTTSSSSDRRHRMTWLWAVSAGAAMAAVFILTVTLLWTTEHDGVQQQDTINVQATSAYLPDMPQQTSQALRDLWQFYDGQANWIAMTGSDVRMGLTGKAVPMSNMIVASLSLTGPNQQILKTDIALVPGQDVDLHVPRGQGMSMHYQLKVIHDPKTDRLSLKLTAIMDDGVSLTTSFPIGDVPVTEVGRLLTDRGDYQLHLGLALTKPAMTQGTAQ